MSGEEWHWLLAAPSRPLFLYPSARGFTLPQPFWYIREGGDVVTIGWSQSGVVQSIQQGFDIRVLVQWCEGDLSVLFDGKATAAVDAREAETWEQRLWSKFQGKGPMGYSPARCDTVIRFKPSSGHQISTEQVSHQREGYREDSGDVLESKLLFNLERMLQEQGFAAAGSLDQLEFIHAKDVDIIPNKAAVLKVRLCKVIPRSERPEFLRRTFIPGPSCPSWVNVLAFIENGRPRLLKFTAQDPPLLSSPQFVEP
ncbi:MAG: hypothetical protein KF760_09260 [Candidatus Eremiobacteraeota bacterium]|nr:hypothetical protein [Candidatus Eremiobacteraeota bacterium]MCW5869410.1 hypothetical protein [Candidatus Eremiobacteraeota bacterium]